MSLLRHQSRLSLYAILIAAWFGVAAASGQTLARPGWVGSGMTLQSWWTHAVLYEIDPHAFASSTGASMGDLRGVTAHLEYIRSLGVDAITLTRFSPDAATQKDPVARYQSVDPILGTLGDLEDLVRETSRDGMRLVIELDPQQLADPAALTTVARFWLTRGVGGIALRAIPNVPDAPQRSAQIQALRALIKTFAGHRILIDEALPGSPAASSGQSGDLTLNSTLAGVASFDPSVVRTAIQNLEEVSKNDTTLAATDGPALQRSAGRYDDPASAKVLATLLLATRANAQLYFGQELGLTGDVSLIPWGTPADPAAKHPKPPPTGPEVAAEEADSASLLNWYRRLIDLHHSNATLHSGTIDLLNHDDQETIVWISKRGVASFRNPPIIALCNLSAKPVTLSLTEDMKGMKLRGNFLRTILRSDTGMGGMSLDKITLEPYGVYIGELLF
jgi:alpha-glucosidase